MKKFNITFLKNSWVFMYPLIILMLTATISFSCKKSTTPPPVTPPVTTPPTPTVIPPINTNSTTAFEIIKDMGGGFNLGNTFDNVINPISPAVSKQIIDLYYDAGMRHVRIPVTWMQGFSSNLADANGNVNTSHIRFLELKETVDYALAKKMYVVLNAHHEHWLKSNYDGSANYDTKFNKLWTGIATFFKDYPKQLIFDVLNEPDGKMGQWGNSSYPIPTGSAQIAFTRQINKVGYDAIRATGGNNTTRIIMIEPNGQGNQNMLDDVYPTKATLPGGGNDIYLAAQVHTYDPWSFCGETGSNANWPGSTSIENPIKNVGTHAALLNIPVNYGEFGVGRQTNTAERNTDLVRSYYRLVKLTCASLNMSYTVWDDRGWFGLIARSSSTSPYVFTNNIVPTMMAK